MDRINGILRLYSFFILMPILIGCRRRNRMAEDLSESLFVVLVTLCTVLMGLGTLRFLVLSGSRAAVFCRLAEYIFLFLGIGTYSTMLQVHVRHPSRHIRKMPALLKVTWLICLGGIAYWIYVTVCLDRLPGFLSEGNTWHTVGQIWGNAVFLIDLFVLLVNRRKLGRRNTQLYLMHVLLPFTGTVFYYVSGGIAMHYVGITASILLIYILRNEAHEAMVWREMQLSRLAVMESEIRPHFLFNCINSIYALCAEDAVKASRAANALKKYLEGSFSALDAGGLVSMDRELDHIRNYLALEELRFGDKLKVRYELDETGFMIPFLTVQPLVENAVKHGLRRKCGGGTVTIRSRKNEDGAEILVEDDGVGFDASKLSWTDEMVPEERMGPDGLYAVEESYDEGGKEHIGLINVRRRLEAEMQAELTVKSAPGNGTRVRIFIPSEALREVPV